MNLLMISIILLLTSPAMAQECRESCKDEGKELCLQLCDLNEKLDKVYIALENHKVAIDQIQNNEAYINSVTEGIISPSTFGKE